MMFLSKILVIATAALTASSTINAFTPSVNNYHATCNGNGKTLLKAAESEVSFAELDGSQTRIGIIRTRWNDEHVTNLVSGAKQALKECNVNDENIFETEVPGSFELPLAAKYLAMSGTVDAIICAGVLIKGDTQHFEYISDAVSKGIMNVGINTNLPIVFGVLTCNDEEQVRKRSSPVAAGGNNHGYDWGKTAVEMALLRLSALGAVGKGTGMGFSSPTPLKTKETPSVVPKESERRKVGFYNQPTTTNTSYSHPSVVPQRVVPPQARGMPPQQQPPQQQQQPPIRQVPPQSRSSSSPPQQPQQQPQQPPLKPQAPMRARRPQPAVLARPKGPSMDQIPLGGNNRRNSATTSKKKSGFTWD